MVKPKMKKSEIREKLAIEANRKRKELGIDRTPDYDIVKALINYKKFTIVIAPLGPNTSGICYKNEHVIVVNMNQTLGRARFTIAHELYHYFYGKKGTDYISPTSYNPSKSIEEYEADIFASYFLAPRDDFFQFIFEEIRKSTKFKLVDILKIEQHFMMSRKSTLIRLKDDGFIGDYEFSMYENGAIMQAKTNGYQDSLYRQWYAKPTTLGYYLNATKSLYEQNLISKSKHDELLIEAFRTDIVFKENGVIND
jgi:Zn-dependent peptidase ImmA (M78 family)